MHLILADIIAGTVNDITNADISIVRLNRKRLFRLTVRYTAGYRNISMVDTTRE